jgi:hypothetical protein
MTVAMDARSQHSAFDGLDHTYPRPFAACSVTRSFAREVAMLPALTLLPGLIPTVATRMVGIKLCASVRIDEPLGAAQGAVAVWSGPRAQGDLNGRRTLPAIPAVPLLGRAWTTDGQAGGPFGWHWRLGDQAVFREVARDQSTLICLSIQSDEGALYRHIRPNPKLANGSNILVW